jgi:uncharacterized protein with HEPN domain
MSKKEKRDYQLFLEDILESIEKIERYTTDLSFEEFFQNEMVVDAVIRNFEIIGEAVKKIPSEVRNKYPSVEWKNIAGFRDVLAHDYFGIDIHIVWQTIVEDIPLLKKQISAVLKTGNEDFPVN